MFYAFLVYHCIEKLSRVAERIILSMSSKNDGKFESKILQLIPEAQEYERRSNPYLEKYLGRLETRILLQMEYFLRSTKLRYHNRKFIVASYPMVVRWFYGTESIRNIKRALKHLMDLGIVETLPLSHQYHKANCYCINYSQCAFIVKTKAADDRKKITPEEQFEAWMYAHEPDEYDVAYDEG